jgi:YYY domain-containing protein
MEDGLVAVWLGVYLALLLAGVPLAAVLMPRLADRGMGVALPLSAAVLWLVGYWVGHLSLSLAVWVGLAVLLGCTTVVVVTRDLDLDGRLLAETAAVFTAAFCFLVAIRAVDPAVHPAGGEKFLDFGLLKSLHRSSALPPQDMWFAGEPVKYYYGGHLLADLLTRLTGTDPRFSYNLALAGFYAMLVTAAYGLAGTIAADRGSPRRLGGAFGVFFVGLASNLTTPVRFLVWLLPDAVAGPLAGLLTDPQGGLAGSLSEFSYWDASRVIPGTINEFPLFAWLNGDLHAHMMSTPFLLLVAALLFGYYRTPESARSRRRLLVLGALPPLAALVAVVNTWSFPSVGGLTLLTLYLAPTDPRTLLPQGLASALSGERWGTDEVGRFVVAGAFGAAVVVGGVVLSGPFWLGTASGRSIGLFTTRSGLVPLLLVHGGFLLLFGLSILRYSLPSLERRGRALVMLGLVVTVALFVRAPAVALLAPLVGISWALLRFADGRPGAEPVEGAEAAAVPADGGVDEGGAGGRWVTPGYEAVLLVAGAGLVLLVEFVFVEEQAGPGRMNTVFKTYMQVWILWGVAAGATLAHLVWQHRPALALSGGRWRPALRGLAAVLIVSTSIFGVLALSDHFGDDRAIAQTDDPTLDATRFVEVAHPEEAPAIRWLDETVEGQPTIVSTPGGYFWDPEVARGSNAPSSLTGIPTVVGWHHEIGYRGEAAYRNRTADVRDIYTGDPATQARLLAKYDVRYVYVGPVERAAYVDPGFRGVEGVTVEKEWDAVTIYRVDQEQLRVG